MKKDDCKYCVKKVKYAIVFVVRRCLPKNVRIFSQADSVREFEFVRKSEELSAIRVINPPTDR